MIAEEKNRETPFEQYKPYKRAAKKPNPLSKAAGSERYTVNQGIFT